MPETTYLLLNSGNYFRKLCGEPSTRDWLENTIKYGMKVYMVVGIHTIRPSSMHVGSGHGLAANRVNGEQVFAVQYRKVSFKWHVRRAIDKAFLKTECIWAVSKLGGRGTQDNDDDEIVEADFEDFIDKDDVKMEDQESYSLEGEVFVF